jgi:hypothetical protein
VYGAPMLLVTADLENITAANRAPKTAGNCVATVIVGNSSACLLGCITFAVWSSAGSITKPTSSACSSLVVSSF